MGISKALDNWLVYPNHILSRIGTTFYSADWVAESCVWREILFYGCLLNIQWGRSQDSHNACYLSCRILHVSVERWFMDMEAGEKFLKVAGHISRSWWRWWLRSKNSHTHANMGCNTYIHLLPLSSQYFCLWPPWTATHLLLSDLFTSMTFLNHHLLGVLWNLFLPLCIFWSRSWSFSYSSRYVSSITLNHTLI